MGHEGDTYVTVMAPVWAERSSPPGASKQLCTHGLVGSGQAVPPGTGWAPDVGSSRSGGPRMQFV